MKIFSKKAYRFTRYKGRELAASAEVDAQTISPVPDWVQDDLLFKLALKAGNISIIGKAGDSNLDVVDAVMAEAKNPGIQNPGNMTVDQLQKAI